MEPFSVEGHWWLPARPSRRVPGTLKFDSSGLQLTLYDALHEFEPPGLHVVQTSSPDWTVEPVLHGRNREGDRYTLFEVGGANVHGPFDTVQENYWAEVALAGCHTSSDMFSEVWCEFDYLDAWADPPSISESVNSNVEIQVASQDLAVADVGSAMVRLVSGVRGRSGGNAVHLDRWTSFGAFPGKPRPARALVDEYVRPLQDLLIFGLGRPVRLTSMRLMPVDRDDRRDGTSEAYFPAVQPDRASHPKWGDIESYTAPTVLSLHRPTFDPGVMLERWFALWSRYREVLTLLLSPLYAPFMYSEQGFAATFQSAEAMHDATLPTLDVVKAEHRKRVDAAVGLLVASGLEPAVVEWATKVLSSRNDKPLARKIDDLVASTGRVGAAVLEADPRIGATTARARAAVAHGGAAETLDAASRHWYGQVLRWVVRARLLAELFDDPADAEDRVLSRSPFRHAVEQIRSTSSESALDAPSDGIEL